MRRRAAIIISLSVVAISTARQSLVHAFVRCRHEVHFARNCASATAVSLADRRRRRRRRRRRLQQQYLKGDNDDVSMTTTLNDSESTTKLHNRFRRFRSSPHFAPHIRRVVLLSDLHMDYTANRDWLSNLCSPDGDVVVISSNTSNGITDIDDMNTMMIVAGDVSHDLDILRWTFQTLKRKYGEVAYTPGNHELWIDRDGNADGVGSVQNTSIDKLERVLQLCLEENIRIGPMRVGAAADGCYGWDSDGPAFIQKVNDNTDILQPALWVVPLLSWHHPSFDKEPPIECWGGIPSARKVVADYRRTRWPSPLSMMDDSIAHFIDSLNDVILDLDSIADLEAKAMPATTTPTTMLTFSHFIPRIELLPEKRYLSLPTLPRCVGSTFLENRLRRMGEKYYKSARENSDIGDSASNSDTYINRNNGNNDTSGSVDSASTNNLLSHHLHAFGHTHLAWDAIIDGVRYVHVPLAYPREWEQRRRSLEIGTMKGEVGEDRLPVCLWEQTTISDTAGFPAKWLGGWWSKYYSVMPRKPHRNKELAPWVAKRFR